MALCSPALRRSLGPVAMVMAAFAAVPAVGQTPPPPPAEPFPPARPYNLDQVGLITDNYDYVRPSTVSNPGIYRDTRAVSLNGGGQVVGHSARFNERGVYLGEDAWIAEPGVQENAPAVTLQIGFVGPGYEYTLDGHALDDPNEEGLARESRVDFLSENGIATGFTSRFATTYNQDEGQNNITEFFDDGIYLGQDAWRARTGAVATVERLGLVGPEYDFEVSLDAGTGEYRPAPGGGAPTGTFRESKVSWQNAQGQAVGFTMRYTEVTGSNLGSDAWYAAPNGVTERINLDALNSAPGAAYQWTREGDTDGGLFRESGPTFINGTGQIMGYATRWSSSGGSRGSDTWITALTPAGSPGTPQLVGLMGPNYEFTSNQPSGGLYRNVAGFFMNDAGFIAGTSERFEGTLADLTDGERLRGFDAWMVTPATATPGSAARTHRIGLVGLEYEYTPPTGGITWRKSEVKFQNPLGDIVGTTLRFDTTGRELGSDAWLSRPSEVNALGEVLTYRISLAGGAYEYEKFGPGNGFYRFGVAQDFHLDGFAVGFNDRFTPTGRPRGRDAWFAAPGDVVFNGVADDVRRIGLDAASHTSANRDPLSTALYEFTFSDADGGGVMRYSEVVSLNDALEVIGISKRFGTAGQNLGQAGWVYDYFADEIRPLEFSFRDGDNFSFTLPQRLTESGVVLGTYTLFSGTGNNITAVQRAFWWSPTGGGPLGNFRDLASLVEGATVVAGTPPTATPPAPWQELADVDLATGVAPGGSPANIVGTGFTTGQSTALGSQSVYLVSTVPEPTAMALLALPAAALLRRRRRN